MADDFQPWGGGSRLAAYFRKKARTVYDRGERAPVDVPCLRGVVTDNAATDIPMPPPEELPPARQRYRYR